MNTLGAILVAAFCGGILSVVLASVSLRLSATLVHEMVSYAIGALLGAAFLGVLPHALEHFPHPEALLGTVLAGILFFFVLEKLVIWRHCHTEHCEVHGSHTEVAPGGHDHGRSGLMIIVGDTFHNFADGVMIAATFLTDFRLGVVTALAIVAHEIPQELGDFMILLHSGYSRAKALALNLLASLATLIGALLGYFLLAELQRAIPYILALSAASMIYVAIADLIPGLHKRPELRATLHQVLLILLGMATVYFVGEWAHGLMSEMKS